MICIVATAPESDHIPNKIARDVLAREYFCANLFSAVAAGALSDAAADLAGFSPDCANWD